MTDELSRIFDRVISHEDLSSALNNALEREAEYLFADKDLEEMAQDATDDCSDCIDEQLDSAISDELLLFLDSADIESICADVVSSYSRRIKQCFQQQLKDYIQAKLLEIIEDTDESADADIPFPSSDF